MTHRAAIHQIVDRFLLPNPVPGEVQVGQRLVLREAFGHSNAALRPDAIPRQVEHLDAVIHREVVRELRDAGAADGAVAEVQLCQRRGVAQRPSQRDRGLVAEPVARQHQRRDLARGLRQHVRELLCAVQPDPVVGEVERLQLLLVGERRDQAFEVRHRPIRPEAVAAVQPRRLDLLPLLRALPRLRRLRGRARPAARAVRPL